EEDFVFVSAQPDCDEAWLAALDDDAIRSLDQDETLSLLERREYRFHCGCSMEKLFPIIAGMSSGTVDEVFGGEEVTVASCPRCGARYALTREALEAYIADHS
ncbi:MAG: Hsp33 family molecular chaperone HslO, partial [Verrucomicrobiota bacterium]